MRRLRIATAGMLPALLPACPAALAQAPQLATPAIYEPGVISGPSNDGAPTFSPDGETLLLERSNGAWSVIVQSARRDGRWSTPTVAAFSGPSSDQQPAMSPDGKYLVYASTRPAPGPARQSTSLFRVDRVGPGWSAPSRLPDEVNISARVFKPSVAANGDIYFMSDDGDGHGPPRWRLYRAAMIDGRYRRAAPLPFSDGSHPDVDPYVAPDQSYVIFSSKGRRLPRDDDHEHLYLVRRDGAGWGPVTPMRYAGDERGYDDGEAQVSPDGRTLFFTSGRMVPIRLDRSRRELVEDVARMDVWDNGNNNVWTLALAPFLDAAPAAASTTGTGATHRR